MEKVYTFRTSLKVFMMIVFAIGAAGSFTVGGPYGYAWIVFGIALFCCMVIYLFRYRIVITDKGIRQDLGIFGWRSERNWDEIVRVSRFGNVYGYFYRIECVGRKSIIFGDMLDTYRDVLREVVARAPQATVDDSITRLLQKMRHKEWLTMSKKL
ncbi:MAG: hypothetical protein WAX04_13780 [Oscillospiraceae bacterium]